ncbi:hypothetical protein EUX98_g7390 [Antrodiella citrinella]|uniref:Reverse transcriptase Ty1/copia-type domain-containing protein n=1 Tax=Antrodiella citrinella TaxID=2447956 RepID=A0A4S4MNC0_9APHY|nr:hypothetical protein EUX98_g7390 [Antrodiella citrinella]
MHKVLLPVEDPDDDIAEGALPAPQPAPEPAPAQDNLPELHDDPVEPVPAPNPQPEPVPLPAPAPVPAPEKSRSRSRKKGDMGPPPAPSRKSSRSSNPPGEWWKVSNSSQYRDPDPPIPETDDERELAQETAEEDDRHAALLTEGVNFMYSHELNTEEALVYAFNTRVSFKADEPRTFSEAMRRPDADKWYQAAQDEIKSHLENGTWELAQLPEGCKAIGSRWVFRIKYNADGSIERYKARLVAQGFAQRPGLEYDETFASTLKWATLRIILAIAAIEDMEIECIDFSTAYLNGEIDKDVYMKQPEGFADGDQVCKLGKGIYGLKQGGRLWYKKLAATLVSMGFKILRSDNSVYVLSNDTVNVVIPVFVDDCTLVSKDKVAIQKIKDELVKRFKLRDLGPINQLLGVQITRDRSKRTLSLSQRQYTLDILLELVSATLTESGHSVPLLVCHSV